MLTLEQVEKRHTLAAIVEYNYDLEAAAEALGITKRTLYRMLGRWNLPTPAGGNPHTTKWSVHQKRCQKIFEALEQIKLAS